MYAYCNNNPVMYVDSQGNSPIAILALIAISAIVLSLTACDVTNGGSLEGTPMDPRPDNATLHDNPEDAINEGIAHVMNSSIESNWSREYGVAIIQYDDSYYVDMNQDNGGGTYMKCVIPTPNLRNDHYRLVAIIHSHTIAQDEPFKPYDSGGDWDTYYNIYNQQVESYIIDYVRPTNQVRIRYMPVGMEDCTRWKYWEGAR